MSRTESRKGKSAYFVPTISISLVLIVVGMLVFILLNARAVSDHVKRNIGFAVIVKDNTNEVERILNGYWELILCCLPLRSN